jgi:hypothetical protein
MFCHKPFLERNLTSWFFKFSYLLSEGTYRPIHEGTAVNGSDQLTGMTRVVTRKEKEKKSKKEDCTNLGAEKKGLQGIFPKICAIDSISSRYLSTNCSSYFLWRDRMTKQDTPSLSHSLKGGHQIGYWTTRLIKAIDMTLIQGCLLLWMTFLKNFKGITQIYF